MRLSMVSQFPKDRRLALVPAQKSAVCAFSPRVVSIKAVKRRCRIMEVVLECSINQDTFISDAVEAAKRLFVVPIASVTGIVLVVGNVTTIEGPITRSSPFVFDALNASSEEKGKKGEKCLASNIWESVALASNENHPPMCTRGKAFQSSSPGLLPGGYFHM